MNHDTEPKAPQLSRLQSAWLQEIGLDRRMLARYAEASVAGAAPLPPAQPEPADPAPSKPPRELLRVSTVLAAADSLAPQARAEQLVPQSWEALAAHVAQCQGCGLHVGRGQAVFGMGVAEQPEWLVIGEAPGGYDDRVGLPFQGKAGLLLQAMLASICVTDQPPVFFTNLIKCRPLGNRRPEPDEIAACLPYLQRQITLLKPRGILALGALAAQAVLGVSADLEALRGTVHAMRSETGHSIPVVVTYHPAALLLRPQHKPDAWRDLNLARAVGEAAGI